MSGGYFEYSYTKLAIYEDEMEDEQLNEMIKDLVKLLRELEWYKSFDTSEKTYRKEVRKFKKKWFGNPDKKLKDAIISDLDKLKDKISKR